LSGRPPAHDCFGLTLTGERVDRVDVGQSCRSGGHRAKDGYDRMAELMATYLKEGIFASAYGVGVKYDV